MLMKPLEQGVNQEGCQGLLQECHQGLEPGKSPQHFSRLDHLHPQQGCSRLAPQLCLPLDFLLCLLLQPGCLHRLYTLAGQIELNPPRHSPDNHPDCPPLLPPLHLLLALPPLPPHSLLPLIHCLRSFPESHLWLAGSRREELWWKWNESDNFFTIFLIDKAIGTSLHCQLVRRRSSKGIGQKEGEQRQLEIKSFQQKPHQSSDQTPASPIVRSRMKESWIFRPACCPALFTRLTLRAPTIRLLFNPTTGSWWSSQRPRVPRRYFTKTFQPTIYLIFNPNEYGNDTPSLQSNHWSSSMQQSQEEWLFRISLSEFIVIIITLHLCPRSIIFPIQPLNSHLDIPSVQHVEVQFMFKLLVLATGW